MGFHFFQFNLVGKNVKKNLILEIMLNLIELLKLKLFLFDF